ncbi:MAG: hypothetical protein A3A44_01650 [Candidatus Sungbacteria bacterium RIFCSPLOWO2_01_FULL_60_25]|uniref:Large ribosomal subunit protein uL15 n=1 Tax=Candidatus Sungbacteria bacterium RIFCSPLOWO2_01_FULL_60_25 TaxID=1802281 RepID=A0A1G2LFH4_9BACT|nr:MAG: hypothetical protein A3A44_01650 [Candidatus Sungbacteria bacterium RIFCSPLOWO2_01_FULL_60_25]
MQLHNLQPRTRPSRAKRVGRGGKRGTTAGRGTKGQKARAGHKIRPAIRDIMKKLPKLRGYRFHSFRPKPAVVDIRRILAAFPTGATVDPAALIEKGIIRRMKGRIPAVKIVGNAAITKRYAFRGIRLSQPLARRIHDAGGSIPLGAS